MLNSPEKVRENNKHLESNVQVLTKEANQLS